MLSFTSKCNRRVLAAAALALAATQGCGDDNGQLIRTHHQVDGLKLKVFDVEVNADEVFKLNRIDAAVFARIDEVNNKVTKTWLKQEERKLDSDINFNINQHYVEYYKIPSNDIRRYPFLVNVDPETKIRVFMFAKYIWINHILVEQQKEEALRAKGDVELSEETFDFDMGQYALYLLQVAESYKKKLALDDMKTLFESEWFSKYSTRKRSAWRERIGGLRDKFNDVRGGLNRKLFRR
jgi:hypothetical protein